MKGFGRAAVALFFAVTLAGAFQLFTTNAQAQSTYFTSRGCVNCHGAHGEGGQQGPLRFPPLLDVSAKPRRTVDDIVGLLKDPPAYGLQPPMRSFSDKLTEQQMREIGEWVVKLKR